MREQSRGPFEFRRARLGRTNLGPSSAVVDDDALTVVAPSSEERSIRLRLVIVQALTATNESLTVELRDGTRLVLDGEHAEALRAAVLQSCRALPELTRALRALGSRRGHRRDREAGPDEQHRFFAPLLAARRAATGASTPVAAIAAFDPTSLERQFAAALHLFATERFAEQAPARRALEAELVDLVEPLRDALAALALAATDAVANVDDLGRWRAWSSRLLTTFEIADRVWLSLDDALGAARTWRGSDGPRGRGVPGKRTPPAGPRLPFRKRP